MFVIYKTLKKSCMWWKNTKKEEEEKRSMTDIQKKKKIKEHDRERSIVLYIYGGLSTCRYAINV
jgi:hypothetical protein